MRYVMTITDLFYRRAQGEDILNELFSAALEDDESKLILSDYLRENSGQPDEAVTSAMTALEEICADKHGERLYPSLFKSFVYDMYPDLLYNPSNFVTSMPEYQGWLKHSFQGYLGLFNSEQEFKKWMLDMEYETPKSLDDDVAYRSSYLILNNYDGPGIFALSSI